MRIIPTILACLLVTSACQPPSGPTGPGSVSQSQRATIPVQVQLGSAFATAAGQTIAADVASLSFSLLNANAGDAVVASHSQSGTSYAFTDVADGRYKVRVNALDASGASLIQGPGVPTSGVIQVNAGIVAYPGGLPGLTLSVPLKNGTGETILNQVSVSPIGQPVTPANYRYRLIRTDVTPNTEVTHTSTRTDTRFSPVQDGTYQLGVEAFNASGRSITDGGEQRSQAAVVNGRNSPAVAYPDGSSMFNVSLRLFRDVWTAKAPMPTARAYAAMATGADGRIYACGGGNLTTAEAYDPATNTWTTLASLGTARDYASATRGPDGKIYVIGGTSVAADSVEAYDPAANAWTPKRRMPTRRWLFGLVTAPNGLIYAVGGNASGATGVVEVYDTSTDTWSTRAGMITARRDLTAAVGGNGKIYVFGGVNAANTFESSVEAYDPVTDTWTSPTSMPGEWYSPSAVTGPDGRIYVFSSWWDRSRLDIYDPFTNAWVVRASQMPSPRYGFRVAAGMNGKLYVGGGYFMATNYDAFAEYDP